MTPEQIADRESVWARMAVEHPEFTREHDAGDNWHAVREIVLSGSLTWAAANGFFQPRAGSRVMDIGANTGIYSAYCGLHGAHVTAYEPFPTVFAMLSGMLERTDLTDRVEAINAAVWTFTGEVPYIGHETPNDDVTCFNGGVPTSGVRWTLDDFKKADTVPCISLDDAIGNENWDMVKIDIEGGELEVLLAASVDSLKRIKFAYVEFHDWADQALYDETLKKIESVFRCQYFRSEPSRSRYEVAYLFRK
jgi:FkbM family methyltransferase